MQPARSERSSIRLAELMAALSIATDLGMGQPMEFAMTSCVLAVRLGEKLGLGDEELREVYYQALLRYIGCNSETSLLAAFVGDEIAMRADYARIDSGKPPEVMGMAMRFIRQANQGAPPLEMARSLLRGMMELPGVVGDMFAGHCEVGQRLAERMGFEGNIVLALGQLYERWDGKGAPRKLKGEEIATAVRVVTLAQDAVTFHRLGGTDAATAVARERKGGAYDPRMADCFCENASHLCAGLGDEPSWEAVLSLEPGARLYLTEERLDASARAMADFSDIKTPFTLGHSPGVASLAAGAARRCGLPEPDIKAVWRAALLHEIGITGVSVGIWNKPGPLSERDWERVRLHTYYTERILARPWALADLGALASLHHERLDGSGYHRGAQAAALSPAARILAAADVYQAMTEPRPHRPPRSPEAAAEELRRETRRGKLDAEAVNGVLAAAGHKVPTSHRLVAGLSERQVEVLRLLARGNSIKQIAAILSISEKTADNHIQHIYNKIGVSTRAGATLFAMEQDLLGASPLN